PKCRHTEQILVKTGVTCPVNQGELIEKKTRKGRTFYGCTKYPACEWTSWKLPVKTDGDDILVEKKKDEIVPTACEYDAEKAAEEAAKQAAKEAAKRGRPYAFWNPHQAQHLARVYAEDWAEIVVNKDYRTLTV
ncbi:MAG: type I DNA topoisomerase, partial [Pseudomonadota bacterium]